MKISKFNCALAIGAISIGINATKIPQSLATSLTSDVFEYKSNTNNFVNEINDCRTLEGAPSPKLELMGVTKNARIVVDIKNNVLYTYSSNGKVEKAYSVASGKSTSPTHTGIRVVSHVERYPYSSAPRNCKRRKSPNAFGPKIIILNLIDPKTGERRDNGEYIHGNNDEASIGKFASHGCMRMHNDEILEVADKVKSGDIVNVIR